ncbi:MAG TPA: hypothetical protein VE130_05200 [Nitrososphaeraceae archaeon]|jgi:hypothetical protein|nr:hypothetical protein [Nitrososphaeraceae archaeon]
MKTTTKRKKSVTEGVTFRLPSDNLEQLCKEAETRQISVNTLVNQIINEHLDWHLYAAQAKLYYVPKPFISRILEKFTEQQLADLAEASAKKDFVDIGLLLRGEFTISSFLNILENWSRISDIPYRTEENGTTQKIIIEHNMGPKYSYLFKEIYRRLLENAFETKTKFDITDNTIVLTFNNEVRPLEKEAEC